MLSGFVDTQSTVGMSSQGTESMFVSEDGQQNWRGRKVNLQRTWYA